MYLEFKPERDRDFMAAYAAVVRDYGPQAPYIKKEVLLREAVHRPARRFYVSPEQATRIVSRLLRDKPVLFRNPVKREMYGHLLAEVRRLRHNAPGMSVSRAVVEAVYSPAPRFYLTEESASVLYYQLLRQTV